MSPIGVLVGHTWESFQRRWRTLVAIMALELVGRYAVMLAGTAALIYVLTGGIDLASIATLTERFEDIDLIASRLAGLIAVLFPAVLVLAVFEGWILTSLLYAADKPESTLREALAGGWSHLIPCGVVMGIASAIVTLGFFLFVLPGLVLSVLFLLAPNAYFAEGKRGWDALTRSRECVSARFGDAALRLGLGWLGVLSGALVLAGAGVPFVSDAFLLVAVPWIALYQASLFRELAGAPA